MSTQTRKVTASWREVGACEQKSVGRSQVRLCTVRAGGNAILVQLAETLGLYEACRYGQVPSKGMLKVLS